MPNDDRIYIKLPPAVTSDELKTHFSEFGKITDVYIPLNPATQKPKVLAARYSDSFQLSKTSKNVLLCSIYPIPET
jgi:hypothetical protein